MENKFIFLVDFHLLFILHRSSRELKFIFSLESIDLDAVTFKRVVQCEGRVFEGKTGTRRSSSQRIIDAQTKIQPKMSFNEISTRHRRPLYN